MPGETVLCGRAGYTGFVTVAIYQQWERESDVGWSKKPQFIRNRLRERYIVPIAGMPAPLKNGFAVMAVNCLLVETIQAFREGLVSTKGKSQECFINFFTGRATFGSLSNPQVAEKFYKEVRCGILHRGETDGGWTIRRKGPVIEGMAINATRFHHLLAQAIEDYAMELADGDQRLRENFDKKMKGVIQGCG